MMVSTKAKAQQNLTPINVDSLADDINGIADLLICADESLRPKFERRRDFDLFSSRLRGASAANKLVHLELIGDDPFATGAPA